MKKNLTIAAIILCIAICNAASAQTWKINGNILDSTGILGSISNNDVRFITNGAARMTIKKNGKIGIGTKAPSAYLHVFGTTQIENNSSTIYDEPLLTLRNSAANGVVTNPAIAFKGDDTTYAIMGYDFSTRDIVMSTKEPLFLPNLVINRNNGYTGLNTKTPKAQLDINSNIGEDALRVQVDSSTKLYVNDRGGVSIGTGTFAPANSLYVFGNTGLGISTPLYKLDVAGTSRFSGNVGIQTTPGSRTLQVGAVLGSLMGIGSSEYIQDFGTSTLATNNDWIPFADNIWELGHSDRKWKDVWAVDGTINTSDARDKTNVRDLNYGLKEIMQLHSIKFNWKNNPAAGDKLGVIAQEIQKVLPEVVRDWDYKTIDEASGKQEKVPAEHLGVMYADIIPVLIRGMQEQQKEIEDLKQMVNQLMSTQSNSQSSANIALNNASIEQNTPNPVKNFTVIHYNIGSNNAQLNFTDVNGKTVKQIKLNKGTASVNIDCTMLPSGAYQYALIVDGKIIGSKQMILAK